MQALYNCPMFSLSVLLHAFSPIKFQAMTGINCDGLATRFADREGRAECQHVYAALSLSLSLSPSLSSHHTHTHAHTHIYIYILQNVHIHTHSYTHTHLSLRTLIRKVEICLRQRSREWSLMRTTRALQAKKILYLKQFARSLVHLFLRHSILISSCCDFFDTTLAGVDRRHSLPCKPTEIPTIRFWFHWQIRDVSAKIRSLWRRF